MTQLSPDNLPKRSRGRPRKAAPPHPLLNLTWDAPAAPKQRGKAVPKPSVKPVCAFLRISQAAPAPQSWIVALGRPAESAKEAPVSKRVAPIAGKTCRAAFSHGILAPCAVLRGAWRE